MSPATVTSFHMNLNSEDEREMIRDSVYILTYLPGRERLNNEPPVNRAFHNYLVTGKYKQINIPKGFV